MRCYMMLLGFGLLLTMNACRPDGNSGTGNAVPLGKELCRSEGLSVVRDTGDSPLQAFPSGAPNTKREFINVPLLGAISYVWEVHHARIVLRGPLPEGTFNLSFPPKNASKQNLQTLSSQAFQEAFHLKFRWEELDRTALVVSAPGGWNAQNLVPTKKGEFEGRETTEGGLILSFTGYSMDDLCNWMEWKLEDTPVVNETKIDGNYDFAINNEVLVKKDSIPEHVQELGFSVRREMRRMKVLIVEHE